ncbi:MAG TPA: hypothetical protein VFH66_12355, partial [Mycobacteriales bacterium]|nr:hypothetical protein [Mycobacteriales bacterium]
RNRRLRTLLSGSDDWEEFETKVESRPLLDGRGNMDTYNGVDLDLSAVALRLLDPTTDEWWIYWANGRSGRLDPPVIGRMDGTEGTFFGDDEYAGNPIRVRFVWCRVGDAAADWAQAFSRDDGATWETNWTMSFTRA